MLTQCISYTFLCVKIAPKYNTVLVYNQHLKLLNQCQKRERRTGHPNKWVKEDRNRVVIAIARNNRTSQIDVCTGGNTFLDMTESILTHMLHDDRFADMVCFCADMFNSNRETLMKKIQEANLES